MNPWKLLESNADLTSNSLIARVDLLQPMRGLHSLKWNGAAVDGNLLGVTVAPQAAANHELATAGMDRFVRGADLVANYPQCDTQPFTLHIYWRIATTSQDFVVLDAIVSLQTSLLESFPKVILTTELPPGETWVVPTHGDATQLGSRFESSEGAGVLLRSSDRDWSYLEVTHPHDLGLWQVETEGTTIMQRELGGEFQEKGVIRRLRVRGAFLPSNNDLDVASGVIADFVDSPPPLTA